MYIYYSQYIFTKGNKLTVSGCFSLGQNIGKGYTSWSDAIKDWWAEKKDFTYGGANDFHKVGHYTQVGTSIRDVAMGDYMLRRITL